MNDPKITREEIIKNWTGTFGKDIYVDYLVNILNREYDLDEAIADIKSFREENQ